MTKPGEGSVYDFDITTIDGEPLPLANFDGKVLLLVNTASQCGFTPQYEGLQQLQQAFGALGFSVIAFPCNQFGRQEPGDAQEVAEFCRTRYDVSFPVSAKIDVNGSDAHPLFKYLTASAPGVLGTEVIKWNFTKFLVDRKGRVVGRFAPTTRPDELSPKIEELLQEPVGRDTLGT